MHDIYVSAIVITTIVLAGLSSGRIAYFLGRKKWGLREEKLFFTCACPTLASAILSGFISAALIEFGGLLYGLAGVLLTVPFVGLVWVGIVAGIKVCERMLTGLLNKV